ncbi:TPA: hypothetical protein HA278_03890 [Candidatus Woesearchaeota archaeon]|nr:hypothetical protein [Candidatus Woesearchaeota archaeon]|tara:strand:- start:178 stop:531 length:354 start_codon:yes stop_codon:yes gene_type:complete
MSTKIVRLTSGEEIICNYEEDGDFCELKKPAIIIPTGQGQLGLMPWLAYADLKDKSIKISNKFIVFITDPQTDLLNEYNTAFGSGLFVPANPLGGGILPKGDNSVQKEKNPALKLGK